MKRWFLRLAIVVFVSVWLIIISFPFIAFILAMNNEIMIGPEQGSHVRLFMVSSDEHKGVGIEWSRRIPVHRDCYHTVVKYLLWEGKEAGQDVEFCRCLDQGTGFQEQCPS